MIYNNILTLVIATSLVSNCISKENAELRLQINIIERNYSPSSNILSFKAECRVPSNRSLTEDQFTWYLRKYRDNSTYGKHVFDDQHIPTSEVKTFKNDVVGYTSIKLSVEVKEIILFCLVPGYNGTDELLFRYSNHQVVGANTITFSDLIFDTTNQVDVSVKTSDSFNISWNIDDAILFPGDTQDNIKVLYPENSDNKVYKITLLFSPLKISDVKRKYILLLDFPVSGYRAYYTIHIEEQVNNSSNNIFHGPILPYIIGLSGGIAVTSVIFFLVWFCFCRKPKSTNNQRDDSILAAPKNQNKETSEKDNSNQPNNEINLSNPLSHSDKCLDKKLIMDSSKEKNENLYYSVPYPAVKKKDDSAGTSEIHYQNNRLYHNAQNLLDCNN